jgi:hypothetical protein
MVVFADGLPVGGDLDGRRRLAAIARAAVDRLLATPARA